ncbi:MAG TPA: alkaline phosphatase family protein [Planctomycetes bacterium]|nr:alkaline phosphatase family protein [Planctomycetota bacterium]
MKRTVQVEPSGLLGNPRSAPVLLFGAVYLGLITLLRAALSIWEWSAADLSPLSFAEVLGVGFLRDVFVFAWAALPAALFLWVAPVRWFSGRVWPFLIRGALFLAALALVFSMTAEWLFWEEFRSRFNFIALDYLIYTREVIGNIVESYPLIVILPAQALVALGLVALIRRPLARAFEGRPTRGGAAVLVALLIALAVVDTRIPAPSNSAPFPNRFQGELASNGLGTLVRAYRDPILDYETFYRSLPTEEAFHRVRNLLAGEGTTFVSEDPHELLRSVDSPGPERRLNVILVVVESLSAKFVGSYGNQDGLTPQLDLLAPKSLRFTNLFATGCRTVRGLEALSLSVPPTPGRSILHRDHNENLAATGWIFKDRGYDTKFFYGGRAYFDGMDHFFENNGFEVVDRSGLSDEEVTFQNAWGVCDEDLFGRVLRDGDRSAEEGKPFFSMVMTTSNHRPYTYPDVVPIPSGSGRHGAVQYADHALGRLIEQARTRPWFDDTLFVIVADHCASSAGKREINLAKHRIPLFLYGPSIVEPGTVDRVASQIDVPPTIFGLLGFDYQTRFFGQDLLRPGPERALVGNYQSVGLLRNGVLTLLLPKKEVAAYRVGERDALTPIAPVEEDLLDAISYYQVAGDLFRDGGLARIPSP